MDYIDIVGVRYIFVQLARERRRSSYRQMGLQGRERSALEGGPPGPISKTECSPNYRRLLLNSLVGRLNVVLLLLVSVPPV